MPSSLAHGVTMEDHHAASEARASAIIALTLSAGLVAVEENRLQARTILDRFGALANTVQGSNALSEQPAANSLLEVAQNIHLLDMRPHAQVSESHSSEIDAFTPHLNSPSSSDSPLALSGAPAASVLEKPRRRKLMPAQKEAILELLDPALAQRNRKVEMDQEEFQRYYGKWRQRKQRDWYNTDPRTKRERAAIVINPANFKAFVQRETGLRRARHAPQQAQPLNKKQRM